MQCVAFGNVSVERKHHPRYILRRGVLMLTLAVTLISILLGAITKKLVDHVTKARVNCAKRHSKTISFLVGSLGTVCCVVVKMIGAIVAFIL